MVADIEMQNNKIGSAIQYFREIHHISQGKLCQGLCSVATLSRIEAGERDVDSFLLETLLERLGKTPNHFELILTDFDYISFQNREEIKKQIDNNNIQAAYNRLHKYEKIAGSKGTVHKQFILTSKAYLNELQGGSVEETINLLMDAISSTVPDFKTNKIKDYYLSNTEMNLIIDIIKRMISADMIGTAKSILMQVIEYLDFHHLAEDSYMIYPKVAIIASRLFMQSYELNKALEMCEKGIDKNKGNRKLDYLGELSFIKAQIMEALLKAQNKWVPGHKDCLKQYLKAYYVLEFCEEYTISDEIKKHLQEDYQWEGID
ncbi:helix-turn-helix transcriptional regulator [Mobilitalea sibirica]|uniref:Helix-turn-helix transcriptional regulator n=1 Tax=Mobilitalea sibirica TaxID=1462919 RepID=A0A8J7H161_9FIRM|nr:helix-turn-helix transcriptional regulator [Mobilitalea sibirica]MBH1940007.1 helix-turn-helix transcriptional regulator [Mobilitalea sibirica]